MENNRESIFISIVRSFCKTFFTIIAVFFALFFILIFFGLLSPPYTLEQKTTVNIRPDLNDEVEIRGPNSPVILRINIHGVIGEPLKLDSDAIEHILVDS